MKNSIDPIIVMSLSTKNPTEVANFFRTLADEVETFGLNGERLSYYADDQCNEAKIKWSRSMADDTTFCQFKDSAHDKPNKPYGQVVYLLGTQWSTHQIRTCPMD